MGKKLRKLLLIALVLVLVLSSSVMVFGAPAPSSGINVQYNGQQISFKDASPKLIEGRTMVPFRQILETMGAKVEYDQNSKTITATRDDMQFSFAIGGTDINITENGKLITRKMDVAPFIDKSTNRTYVPARFMAESMNYGVCWDQTEKTAVIIAPESIFADADQDFSILSMMMTSNVDLEKSYQTTGSFKADITTYMTDMIGNDMVFSLAGNMSGIQQKNNVDMLMNMNINADKTIAAMTAEDQAQIMPLLDMVKDISMQIKMNGDSGDLFMNSKIFATLDPTMAADTWLKMNIYNSYDEMGIDLRPMMKMSTSKPSLSELLQTMVTSMNTGDVNTYKDMKMAYVLMKNLIGDEAFKSDTAGTITTNTLNLDKNDLLAAVAKTVLSEGVNLKDADMESFMEMIQTVDFNADILIREKADTLYSYSLQSAISLEDMLLDMKIIGDPLSTDVVMTVNQPSMMKMSITAKSVMSVTSKMPDLSIPAGAKILDYNSLLMR